LHPRDDDIEFDFFEEELPTAEGPGEGRTRLPGRGGRGGRPRGPVHPSRGLMPMLRLLAFIAIAIAVLVFFGLMLQSCSSTSKHDAYQSYLAKVATIAHSSTQDGVSVATVLTTPGLKATDLFAKLSSIAEQERQNATNAAALNPPGRLRDENQQVVEALQLRVSGTQGLADAFKVIAASTTADTLVSQADRLLASDIVWDDLFLTPTNAELRAEGVSGVQVPESHFVANTDLITSTSMEGVLKRLRGASTGGSPSGLHGTNIVKTVALPGSKELSPSTSNTVIGSTATAFIVTVHDGGDSQEVGIKVTLTIQKASGGGGAITQTKKISVIDAGQNKTVKFSNLGALPFAQKTNVNVDVSAVPGEKTISNNHASYPVLFSLG